MYADFLDPDDVPYLPRLQVTYPRAGVIAQAGGTLSVSCAGRASSLEYIALLICKRTGKQIYLGSFSTGVGAFHVSIPKNIPSDSGYTITIISGPLVAESAEFTIKHGRR